MDINRIKRYTKELNILYVEYEEAIAKHIVKILEVLFRTVIYCKNSVEGLDMYEQDKNFFDIVLNDIYMSNIDGINMITDIKRLNPKQHIVIFSAQNDTEVLKDLINLGVDKFLLKPLNHEQLINTLFDISKNIYNTKSLTLYQKNIENANTLLRKKLKLNIESNRLTGLRNRTSLIKDIDKFGFTMLALIDIDHLEFINNLYGSNIGNLVIQQFAKVVETYVKENNFFIYQTSVDEFAICSNDEFPAKFETFIKGLSQKITNLELYIKEIEDEISIDATIGVTYELNFLASCGIVYESHLLLAQANTALKHAKTHKIPITSYNESINTLQDIQKIMEWKKKIEIAYKNNNIIPAFQPIVDKYGNILKYETLMRLREKNEEGKEKLISPFFFLDIAILTKQYAKISKSIISQAINQLINTNHTLSINLTYTDTQDPKIISLLEESLEKHNIGDRLIFEIVESESIKDYGLLEEFLQKFKPYGVRVAIDDFGSGFSNFENIIRLNANYIKIDGSLIKNIDSDKNSLAIVKAIVQFAHTLGIKIIAEYVHSKEVLKVLEQFNIDEYQGFYFYEPSLEFKENCC